MTGAEGRQGTGGDSWEGRPHNSDHGQTVHLRAWAFEELKSL